MCLASALWEAPDAPGSPRRLEAEWSPGDERPAAVAGATAVAAAVPTSTVERPRPGVPWNPALLREGEPADIDFDTLCRHLTRPEADALRHLLRGALAPCGHAFGAALAGAGERRARARAARRALRARRGPAP